MRTRLLALLVLGVAVVGSACSSDSGGIDATSTPRPEPTYADTPMATPPPEATPAIDIRELDLAVVPDVAGALAETGAVIVQADVIYVDLTNDGFDDAVAPASVDGTLGHIGFIVLTPDGDSAAVLLSEFPDSAGGIEVAVEDGKVVMTEAVPGPDDPECCPSLLRRTVYGWNGTVMAVESVTTEPNPDGGAKKTPSADQPQR